MNILIIADVGGSERHTGDEAMFEVALAELAARGAESFTVIAPNDLHELPRDIVRIAPIGFSSLPGSAHDGDRELRLEQVLSRSAPDDRIDTVAQAVAAADAVVVAGGGNMSSSWPHHLYERVALLELAHRNNKPTIITGQTVGPSLTRRQRNRLGDALASAHFIGVRDRPSLDLVRELEAIDCTALHFDDAIALPASADENTLPAAYVALSVHQYAADRAQVTAEIAALAYEMRARSGLPVVIFPNTAVIASSDASEDGRSNTDLELATEVAKLVGDSGTVRVATITSASTTADGIRRSAALVSMRFHPLVFALAANVPCMAITCDRYTSVKLQGALHHGGLTHWQVPVEALATPIVADLFGELWARRSEIGEHLTRISPAWFDRHQQRWDAIWATINGDSRAVALLSRQPTDAVVQLEPSLSAAHWSTSMSSAAYERLARSDERFDSSEESAFSLQRTLQARDVEIENLRTYLMALETKLAAEQREHGRSQGI